MGHRGHFFDIQASNVEDPCEYMTQLAPTKAVTHHGSGGFGPSGIAGVIEKEHEGGVHHTQDVVDLAELACFDQSPRVEAFIPEIRGIVHHEGQIWCCCRCSLRELTALCDIRRHGLLHENVLAGSKERH